MTLLLSGAQPDHNWEVSCDALEIRASRESRITRNRGLVTASALPSEYQLPSPIDWQPCACRPRSFGCPLPVWSFHNSRLNKHCVGEDGLLGPTPPCASLRVSSTASLSSSGWQQHKRDGWTHLYMRMMTPDDLPALNNLLREEYGDDRFGSARELAAAMCQPDASFIGLVAIVRVAIFSLIKLVYTHKDWRGCGAASALVRYWEAVREHKHLDIEVFVGKTDQTFWWNQGYRLSQSVPTSGALVRLCKRG